MTPLSGITDGMLDGGLRPLEALATDGFIVDEAVVVEILDRFRLHRQPREDVIVLADRGDLLRMGTVRPRENVGLLNMGRLLQVSLVDRSSDLVLADRKQVTVGVGTAGYQTDVVFPRGSFTNMQLRIKSNEELGILDSDYIEDYDGVDGYVTLKRVSDGARVSYPATPLPGETPGINNDVFQITVPLASLNNEVYELEGRVRDIIGNYTVFGSVASPRGDEDLTSLTIEIVDGFSVQYVHNVKFASIRPTLDVILVERGS